MRVRLYTHIGGIIASLLIFPLDVVRRRMQVVGILTKPQLADVALPKAKPQALTMFRDILRNEGFQGLYRGILPELLKVIPMVSVTFCVYEFALQALS